MKLGKKYPAWLKTWRKAGSQAWPKFAQVVAVHWTDAAYSETGHGTLDALLIGFLVKADESSIAIAMEGFEDQETRTHITVPANMVNLVIDVASIRAFEEPT